MIEDTQYCRNCMNVIVWNKREVNCMLDEITVNKRACDSVCDCGKYKSKPAHHHFERFQRNRSPEERELAHTELPTAERHDVIDKFVVQTETVHRAIGDWLSTFQMIGDMGSGWDEEIDGIVDLFYLFENPNNTGDNTEEDEEMLKRLKEEGEK